jgi:hypothetical protein
MDLMGKYNIRFASKESEMSLDTIRRHMRILRRFAAAGDPSTGQYDGSALYYIDKLEEIYGRRAEQTQLQESVRYLDSFQSALPDQQDLAAAAEDIYIYIYRERYIYI